MGDQVTEQVENIFEAMSQPTHSPVTRRVSTRKRRKTSRMHEYEDKKRRCLEPEMSDEDETDDVFITCNSNAAEVLSSPSAITVLNESLVEEQHAAHFLLLEDFTCNSNTVDVLCSPNDPLMEERNAASLLLLTDLPNSNQSPESAVYYDVPYDAETNYFPVSAESGNIDGEVSVQQPPTHQHPKQPLGAEVFVPGDDMCNDDSTCHALQTTTLSKSVMDLAELDELDDTSENNDCINCAQFEESSRSLETVINQLALKLETLQAQKEAMRENHHSEMAIIVDELQTYKTKEMYLVQNCQKMQDDFKSQFNAVREQLVVSKQEIEVLKENISSEKDRCEDLRNDIKILKQQIRSKEERSHDKDLESKLGFVEKNLSVEKQKNLELEAGICTLKNEGQELRSQHNHLKDQLTNYKLLQENLSMERDRNEVLRNENKVLKQSTGGRDSQHEVIEDIRREMETFRSTVEDRLATLGRKNLDTTPTTITPKESVRSAIKDRSGSLSNHDTSTPEQTPTKVSPKPSKKTKRKDDYRQKSNTLRFENNSQQTAELHPNEDGFCRDEDNVEEEMVQRIEKLRERRNKRNRKTLVIGSSHVKSINRQSFNEQLDAGSANIYSFPGCGVKRVTQYLKTHLEEECPHTVVLVAGGNDIPRRRATPKELKDIAELLIEGGQLCRDSYGVSKIVISSILPRTFGEFQGNKHMLNSMLKDLCLENDFTFVDNSDSIILRDHIGRDGIHLNSTGARMFTRNIVSHLNV